MTTGSIRMRLNSANRFYRTLSKSHSICHLSLASFGLGAQIYAFPSGPKIRGKQFLRMDVNLGNCLIVWDKLLARARMQKNVWIEARTIDREMI